jgi:hypothetical protein
MCFFCSIIAVLLRRLVIVSDCGVYIVPMGGVYSRELEEIYVLRVCCSYEVLCGE